MKRWFSLVIIATIFITACNAKTAINSSRDGIAIKGYDTVAYFTVQRPVPGVNSFSYDWGGATWLFANQEHKDMFMANPNRYLPQYGGY